MNPRVVRQVRGESPDDGVRIEYIGSPQPNSPELDLSESRVDALVCELLGENDFLPNDTPPAGLVLEWADEHGIGVRALEVGKRIIR